MGLDEKQAMAIVEMHDACMESAAELHAGRIIKKMGDGVLMEFSSAVNAVQAALGIQKAVADHNATATEKERFQLRIGIHVGDVMVAEGGDLFGDGVNVASRIQPLADPGGICVSRDIFDLVHNKIAIQAVNLGPHDLRHISRQIDIYEIVVDALARNRRTSQSWFKRLQRHRKAVLLAALLAGVLVLGIVAAAVRLRTPGSSGNVPPDKAGDAIADESPSDHAAVAGGIAASEAARPEKEAVIRRQMQFLKALYNDDRPAALAMIDEAALQALDTQALWKRLNGTIKGLRLAQLTADDVRVESVEFPEADLAVVKIRIQRRSASQPEDRRHMLPSFKWKRRDDTWYFFPTLPRQGANRPYNPANRPDRTSRVTRPFRKEP